MPSTYTTNLGLEKPATGEQAGVWGNTANSDYDFIDTATDGNLTIQLGAPAYSLVTNQGAASEGRNKVIIFTGTLTQDANITIVPNTAQKLYFVRNNTDGGFNLIFQQGSGAQFILQNHHSAILYATGTGPAASVLGAIADLQVDNLLVVTSLVIAGTTTFNQPVTFQGGAAFQGTAVTFSAPATFSSITLNLGSGSDAPYDLYYRSVPGPLVRLPIGSAGQALLVGNAGPQWATVSMAIGGAVTGGAANCVLFINSASQMAQDGNFRYSSGVGLGVGVANPTVALHVGGVLPADLWLDNPTPTAPHRTVLAVGGSVRVIVGLDASAETGGNAGSNLGIVSYNDANTALHYHLMGYRNNGHTTIGNIGDLGGRLNVWTPVNEPALVVRGGGGNLQVWQDPSGNQLGYIDAAGHAFFAGSQAYLTLTAGNRLNLWGTSPGAPLGTIHIGPEPYVLGTTLTGSLCMQASGGVLDSVPPNCMRIFLRNNWFVIQFYYNGVQYYAMLSLVGQQSTNVPWQISSGGPGFQG